MTDHHTPAPPETLAQHKERLRQQCRSYRAGIGHSRNVVRDNLGMESVARTAIGLLNQRAQSVFANVSDLFDLKHISGAKLQRLLPLLVSGYSLLSRRVLLKPILRGALIVGVAGTVIYLYSRGKSAEKKHVHVALHEHL